MTHPASRVTPAMVDRVAQVLTARDEQIVRELGRLRVASSLHLERLLFADLSGQHRDRTRRRVLARLVSLGVLATLGRRIGGVRAGSAGLVFTLDILGRRLLQQLTLTAGEQPRARRPGTPTDRFLRHSLSVTELYVSLVEGVRTQAIQLDRFETEPDCWWQDSAGTWIKPDASLMLSTNQVEDAWAIEVDLATESLPTLDRKLRVYLDLVERAETDPSGLLPRVLITVPDDRRLDATTRLLRRLPPPAAELFRVVRFEQAASYLLNEITK
jgi:hypothetical protein